MRKALSRKLREGDIGIDSADEDELKSWEELPAQSLLDVAGELSRKYGYAATDVMTHLQKYTPPHPPSEA
jgi:hypothetical protein